MRRVVACVVCAGCFSKPGFSGGGGGDGGGVDAPACSVFSQWSAATPLADSIAGRDEGLAALDPAGTALVFAAERDGAVGDSDLYLAHWTGSAFGAATRIAALSRVGSTQIEPGFSWNGNLLYYIDASNAAASPVSPGPTFGTPIGAPDLAGLPVDAIRPRFSADGTIAIYGVGNNVGYATRPTPGAVWSVHDEYVANVNADTGTDGDRHHPSITGDGLTLAVSRNDSSLRIVTRTSRDVPFPTTSNGLSDLMPITNSHEAELSRDGTLLLFAADAGGSHDHLYFVTRTCLQ